MQNMTSTSSRIAAGVSAFALSVFLIAASFVPQGAFIPGIVA
ncbi:hypothetical protein [Erythrobacter sp. SG61-1L]|nr:hypothetical protein [Erythrobacter sp. SG61-1L]